MKLLIILAIEEHTKDVHKLLMQEGVPIYSETDIQGFNTEKHTPDISNWFAHQNEARFSKMIFSIQSEEVVAKVLLAIKGFNQEHVNEVNYPVHAYQLNVEASV